MLGVLLDLLVTNQMYSQVKKDQIAFSARYESAAEQIAALTELEEQKSEMLSKAQLSAALVERVPRSILLAELINRMPDRLSLLEFDLQSTVLKPAISRKVEKGGGRMRASRAPTKAEAGEAVNELKPPRYDVYINLTGVAPTDLEVSRYMAELNAYALLTDVTLDYSEEKELEGQMMRKFEIHMRLDPDADVRNVEPLVLPRHLANPMGNELRFVPPSLKTSTAQVDDSKTGKDGE
jgi:Tfp pilus assembly protein PilN